MIVPVIWCRLYLVTNDAPLCLMFLSSRYLTAAWFADEKWNLPGGCSSCQLFLFTEYIECTSMSCALWKVEIWNLSAIMSATSPASTSSTMLDSSMVTMSNCAWCELNGAKHFMGQGTNEQGDSRSRMFLAFAWFHIVQWTMFTFELICALIQAQYHFFFTIHHSAFIRLCFACYGDQLR